jgi:hypothetical protein
MRTVLKPRDAMWRRVRGQALIFGEGFSEREFGLNGP